MRYGRAAMAAMGWVLGCGPVVGNGSGEDDGSGDDTSGADATSDASASPTTAATVDPSSADSIDDTSADESTGTDGPTICADDPATPIAVLAGDTGAMILRADGTRIDLDLPPAASPREANVHTSFAARGQWVAMTRTTSRVTDGVQYEGEVALFAATGERHWLRNEPNVSLGPPLLGDDGIIVAARSHESSTSDGARYGGSDDVLALAGFWPRAEQRADGLVPGWPYPSDAVEPAWFDTITLSIQNASLPVLGSWHEIDDGAFVYLTASGGDVAIVREGPGGAELSALPELGAPPQSGYGIITSSNGRWLLAIDGNTQTRFRIDAVSGTAELLDLTPPPDLSAFQCYDINPTIDDEGRIVMALRDPAAVWFGRLDPATGTWDLLGEPVTAVDDTQAYAHGDTYVLRTSAQGTTFCPPQEYEPADDVLAGATVQVLRPVDGTARTLANGDLWPVPRSDGRCVAMAEVDGVTLVDMRTDAELVVPAVRDVAWWVD